MPPIRPEYPLGEAELLLLIDSGPTAVQVLLASGLVGSWVKIRKLTVDWSATDSPRPLLGRPFWKVSDQLLSRPTLPLATLSWSSSLQVPFTFLPLRMLNCCCGWNRPKNGGPPNWIGVVAASSKIVPLKLACVPVWPTFLNSRICVPSGAMRVA